jgi:hypothetical protein
VVSEQVALDCFLVHVPNEVRVRKLGLKLVSLEENHSLTPKKHSMVEEIKNDREDNFINLLLVQALT